MCCVRGRMRAYEGRKHPFVSSVRSRGESPFFGKHWGEGRERRDSPWIGGRERPRARRRTAGCVTQSPVHRQRASGAAWIRVESLRRRAVGDYRAECGSARAVSGGIPERASETARMCASVGGRAKADGRGESCSVRRSKAAGERGEGEAGNAASSSDARGDRDGDGGGNGGGGGSGCARDSHAHRGNLPLSRRWQHRTISKDCRVHCRVHGQTRRGGDGSGHRTIGEFIRCNDARLAAAQTRYAIYQCFPTSLPLAIYLPK